MDVPFLFWGMVFSAVGLGFFMYGKKQVAPVPMVCGVVLMIYPYFMPNTVVMVILGALLTAVPYFLRL